ncbi:MAG: RHS repeat-associated core domain-containing protein [Pseudomonadales bacterium]|jgi:RHS repeat-associated protein|nr:RHS repeat-associated core domain-containing protein [Pseudomonadales bacterium]MCP5337630.1 RHS repeat-associated core domain-containing protein [Pseudomonadales bacterium]
MLRTRFEPFIHDWQQHQRELGRKTSLTYPGPSNRLAVKHVYNAQGHLSALRNHASNALYYQVNQKDARGNAVDETHGNGLSTIKVYQAATGYLTELRTGTVASPLKNDRQHLAFTFDKLGNLSARSDTLRGFSETFSYDTLNRLTGTSANFGNGQLQSTTVSYDALGNIRSKTGVGTYQYGSQCGAGNRLHAVCQISADSVGTKTASYGYDANGNMTAGDGRTIAWSAFNKPLSVSQGTHSATLSYGPERQLLTRSDNANGQVTETVYVGGLYEKVTLPGGAVEERHTVGGNTLVTYTGRTAGGAGTVKTRYLLRDHLGSVTAITDEVGDEVEAFSFDAWGKRRAPTLAQLEGMLGAWGTLNAYQKGNLTIPALALSSVLTERGFTGHRQLDGVGLIHMGGRVYDAEIGRFLSADPFVGDMADLQALNRYSYVQNNPLSYTDPSGYFLKKLVKGIGRAIGKVLDGVGHAIKVVLQKIGRVFGEVPGLAAAIGAMGCAMMPAACLAIQKGMLALSTAITAANGGTIGQLLQGAAIGLIAGQIGDGLTRVFGDSLGSQAGISMFLGGMTAKAQGGKFADGVKGAAIGFGVVRIVNAVKGSVGVNTSKEDEGT